ncbi:MAG: ABC transporter substrate-binding protein [Acidobacteriota bacterium]
MSNENSTSDVLNRMLSDLVHVNRFTQQPELALAKKYEVAADGRSMTLWLRKGVLWSDGHPFTADDVVFTWNAIFDERVKSPQADLLTIEGKPITIEKVDDATVKLSFPATLAAPERLLDSIFILPKHKLGASIADGTFASQWGVGMNPDDFVTLGPFRLQKYEANVKTVMVRNPHFFKFDKEKQRLPYLDGITFIWVGDYNSERLKFQNLETHVYNQVRQEDVADLRKLEAEKDFKLYDLGPSLATNFMWFNQSEASLATVGEKSYMIFPDGTVKDQNRVVDGAEKASVLKAPKKACVDPIKLAWFRDDRFRQAVSYAINREGIIRSVFYGLGVPLYSGTTQGNKVWYNPEVKKYAYDLEMAKKLLDEAGYKDGNGDGVREDPKGHPIEFSMNTNKGNEAREKMGNIIKEDLEKIGMRIDYKPMDFNSFITKLNATFDYEAGLLSLGGGDVDPSGAANVWKSSGFTHMWYPFQPKPSTDYEKRIDELMTTVQTSQSDAERKKADHEIQSILAEKQPMNFILSITLFTGARNCLGNFRPAVMDHYSLHNQEFLYFKY